MSQSLFYWIIYSYPENGKIEQKKQKGVSILILLDYLFLYDVIQFLDYRLTKVSILILLDYLFLCQSLLYTYFDHPSCLNPYFIGLSILIILKSDGKDTPTPSLNPYFIGLSILIKT